MMSSVVFVSLWEAIATKREAKHIWAAAGKYKLQSRSYGETHKWVSILNKTHKKICCLFSSRGALNRNKRVPNSKPKNTTTTNSPPPFSPQKRKTTPPKKKPNQPTNQTKTKTKQNNNKKKKPNPKHPNELTSTLSRLNAHAKITLADSCTCFLENMEMSQPRDLQRKRGSLYQHDKSVSNKDEKNTKTRKSSFKT